jgi:hypothetical protein
MKQESGADETSEFFRNDDSAMLISAKLNLNTS